MNDGVFDYPGHEKMKIFHVYGMKSYLFPVSHLQH